MPAGNPSFMQGAAPAAGVREMLHAMVSSSSRGLECRPTSYGEAGPDDVFVEVLSSWNSMDRIVGIKRWPSAGQPAKIVGTASER